MEAYYLELRAIHVGAVARKRHRLAGASWPLARPARIMAFAIDTTLLVAAIMLMAIVRQYPFVDAWLTAKVLLLILHIFLGYRSLRAPSLAARLTCLAGATATFLFIFTVARAPDPLGFLAYL